MYVREEHVPPRSDNVGETQTTKVPGHSTLLTWFTCDVMPRSFELNAQPKVNLISRGAIISRKLEPKIIMTATLLV